MLNKTLLSAVLLFLFAISVFAQKQADTSVFGLMKVGEKFPLSECPEASYGGYQLTVKSPCWKQIGKEINFTKKKKKDEQNTQAALTPLTGSVLVAFPFEEKPALSSRSEIMVLVIDGVLEGLGFNTGGISSQDYVMEKLKEKYGEPTVFTPLKVQNRLGASFDAVTAQWNFDNLIVKFNSAEGQITSGLVNIDSPKGKKWREDKFNEIFKNNRSL